MPHRYIVMDDTSTEVYGLGDSVNDALSDAATISYNEEQDLLVYQLVSKYKVIPPKTPTFKEVAL